ncbi:ECF RNA polymerase sigma factor SigW [Phycisphaerales bacterium]|nr:ECF RNA polymerase sigma factor SigW [Phycisphaerales bacterium]
MESTAARISQAEPVPSQPPCDDSALAVRLRAGDEAAFEELVRSAGGRLLAVSRRMLGNEDDAQDAVQESFLSAFRSLEAFDGRSQLTTWLHRIAINVCLMKLRSRRRKPERQIGDLLPEFLEDGHQRNPSRPWNPEGDPGIETSELRAIVRARIDELPAPYREVLLLRDIEELDTEQTAEMLGMTPAAVKTRLHRARQALRALLEPLFTEVQR